MLFLLVCLIGGLTIISIIRFSYHCGISPMPTSAKVFESLKTLLPPNFQGSICDLGSGFGLLGFRIAKTCKLARVTGIENSVVPWLISNIIFKNKNLSFVRQDIFSINLQAYDLVVCYLCPDLMEKLAKSLYQGRPKVLISHTFALPGLKCHKQIICPDIYRTPIYIYVDER